MHAALLVLAVTILGTPPAPSRWVEDTAGMLSPAARANLDERLAQYERATGHQIVVWIGNALDGAALDQWAVETFAAWKLGRKGEDDGVALFVFAEDRKIAIEVGYGLEDELPDATASRIIRETMAPKLRGGDRDGAITDGVDAILAAVEGKPWQQPPAIAKPAAEQQGWLTYVIGAVVLVGFLLLAFKHPRAAMALMFAFMPGRHGGGFGRGGGGGFGGFRGGGGRSGGGGARGGW
jgi:uncharacterized protein